MGKSSPSPPAQQSQTSIVNLPDWVNQAAQSNLAQAYDTSANLAQPYGGQRVADMTSGQTGAIQGLSSLAGQSQPAFQTAQQGAQGVMGYSPQHVYDAQVNAPNIQGQIQGYMDPYTSSVINPTMALMEQQRHTALNQIGDQANAAGAFGGSRQGVAEGVTNGQYGMQEGQMAGQLLNQNYAQALGAAQTGAGQNLQAQQANQGAQMQSMLANQSAGLQGQQLNLQGANSLGGLATAGQNAATSGYQNALTAQGQLQKQQQDQIAAQMAQYQEQAARPLTQLGINMSSLSNTPYGQNSQTNGTAMPYLTKANPFIGALGGASVGNNIFNSSTGTIGGGILGALGSM